MRALDVLVATNRPSVVAFLRQLGERSDPPIVVRPIPLNCGNVTSELGSASVALIDVGTDADTAVVLSDQSHHHRPDLPIVVILCCVTPTMPWHIRGMRKAGVRNLLDAQVAPAEIIDSLSALARGDAGLRVVFHHQYETVWPADEVLSDDGEAVLRMVAGGLSDAEIAVRLHVSPRTAQHRVEELRMRVGARNRTELAAWAVAHGLYVPGPSQQPITARWPTAVGGPLGASSGALERARSRN